MSRTLANITILGGILATVAGTVYWLKDRVHLAPNIGAPEAVNKVKNNSIHNDVAFTRPKKNHFKSKGAKHETSHQRNGLAKVQGTRLRKDEGSSDEPYEIESLTSIYQDQKTESGQRAAVNEEDLSSQAEENRSPIPGVKVAAWVSSQKHAIPKEVPDPKVGTGMRYFLNCMELKNKGVSPLEEKECDALLADRRFKN